MADLRIKDITATATTYVASDFLVLDGSANNVRKILADNLEAQIRNGASDAQMGYVAGLTATDAELNILDGCTATFTELNYLAGITPGASSASKAVVLSAAQNGAIGNNLTIGGTVGVTGTSTLTGDVSCVSSLTMNGAGAIDLNGNDLIIDAAAGSKLYEKATAVVSLNLGSVEEYRFGASAFGCASAGANNLGGVLGAADTDNPNSWGNLNIAGNIFMGETSAPASATIEGSCVIYMDSATGDLKVKIWHSGSQVTATLADFSEL